LFDTEFVLKGVFSKDLSKAFHKAFELRQTADYRSVSSIPRERAEEIYKDAVDFVEKVENYFKAS